MSNNKIEILSKSRELFEKFGYQKTTLTDIAKSVGKVKTAIYYYFSGKEEIFADLVRTEAEDFYMKLVNAIDRSDEPMEQLRTYIVKRVQLMQEISQRYSFLKREFFELMPTVEENRIKVDVLELELLSGILDKGLASKDFNFESTEFTAKVLFNTIKGLEVQMYVTDRVVIDEVKMPHFVNFLINGITGPTTN